MDTIIDGPASTHYGWDIPLALALSQRSVEINVWPPGHWYRWLSHHKVVRGEGVGQDHVHHHLYDSTLRQTSVLELLLFCNFRILLVYHCALYLRNVNFTACIQSLSYPFGIVLGNTKYQVSLLLIPGSIKYWNLYLSILDTATLVLCPDLPHMRRGSGVLSNISCHKGRGQS